MAVIFNDQSLVRILEHGGFDSRIPKMQPARAPPLENKVQFSRELDFEPEETDFDDIWWQVEEVSAKKPPTVEPSPLSQSRQEMLLDLVKRLDGKLCFGSDLLKEKKV